MARRRVDPMASKIADVMLGWGWSPGQIVAALEAHPDYDDVPSKRTVERMQAERRQVDDPRQWVWQDEDPDSVNLVLDTLSHVMDFTEGRVQSFSIQESRRIYLLRKAYPQLKPTTAYMFAWVMNERTGRGEDVDDITGYLMYQPWLGGDNLKRYRFAIKNKWIPGEPPLALQLNDDGSFDMIRIESFFKSLIASQEDHALPAPGRTKFLVDS